MHREVFTALAIARAVSTAHAEEQVVKKGVGRSPSPVLSQRNCLLGCILQHLLDVRGAFLHLVSGGNAGADGEVTNEQRCNDQQNCFHEGTQMETRQATRSPRGKGFARAGG